MDIVLGDINKTTRRAAKMACSPSNKKVIKVKGKELKVLDDSLLFNIKCSECGNEFKLDGKVVEFSVIGIGINCKHCNQLVSINESKVKCPICDKEDSLTELIKVDLKFNNDNSPVIVFECKNCGHKYYLPFEGRKDNDDITLPFSSLEDALEVLNYTLKNRL